MLLNAVCTRVSHYKYQYLTLFPLPHLFMPEYQAFLTTNDRIQSTLGRMNAFFVTRSHVYARYINVETLLDGIGIRTVISNAI